MISSVYWEWALLLQSIKLGVKLTFIYDGIRMFRILIHHKNIVVSIEDIFFWMYSAVIMFEMQLEQSSGVLRGFSIAGMFLGMYLYNKILGERLLRLAEKGITLFKRQLTGVIKMFKINLCKHCDVLEKNRRKHGKRKDTDKKKETEQAEYSRGNPGSNGSSGDAFSGSR